MALTEVEDRWNGNPEFPALRLAINLQRIDWVQMRPAFGSGSDESVATIHFGILSRQGNFERTLEFKDLAQAEAMYRMIIAAQADPG